MEHMSFELKVISCRDIKAFNFFQKLSVYAVVSILNDDAKMKKKKKKEQKQQQSYLQRHETPVDRAGGRNPEWNHMVQIDLKAIPLNGSVIFSNLYLLFQICSKGIGFGSRNIGEVRVPFEDLIDEVDGNLRYVSYQIKTKDGKPKGVLNFSYKVNGKTKERRTDNYLVPDIVHHHHRTSTQESPSPAFLMNHHPNYHPFAARLHCKSGDPLASICSSTDCRD